MITKANRELNIILKRAAELAEKIEKEAKRQKDFCISQLESAANAKEWFQAYEKPFEYQKQLEKRASIIRKSILDNLEYNNVENIIL